MAKWRSSAIRGVPLSVVALMCCNKPNPYFDDDETAVGSGSDQGDPADGGTADGDDGGDGDEGGDGGDGGSGTSGDGGTEPGDTTDSGMDEDCTGFVEPIILLAADAEVGSPMTMDESQSEGTFAYSEVENEGTITFTVQLPCTDEFHIWGRTLDGAPGPNLDEDPDSYYVSVDDPAAVTWYYGCQLQDVDEVWNWTRVDDNEYGAYCSESEPVIPRLTGGIHTITLRNREPMTDDGRVAGIARLLVTNDPGYIPSDME